MNIRRKLDQKAIDKSKEEKQKERNESKKVTIEGPHLKMPEPIVINLDSPTGISPYFIPHNAERLQMSGVREQTPSEDDDFPITMSPSLLETLRSTTGEPDIIQFINEVLGVNNDRHSSDE